MTALCQAGIFVVVFLTFDMKWQRSEVTVSQTAPSALPESRGVVGQGPAGPSTHACLQAESPGFSARRKLWTGQKSVNISAPHYL